MAWKMKEDENGGKECYDEMNRTREREDQTSLKPVSIQIVNFGKSPFEKCGIELLNDRKTVRNSRSMGMK